MEVGWRADMVASCSARGVVTFPGGTDYAFTRASATQTWDTKRDVKRINLYIYLVINSLRTYSGGEADRAQSRRPAAHVGVPGDSG